MLNQLLNNLKEAKKRVLFCIQEALKNTPDMELKRLPTTNRCFVITMNTVRDNKVILSPEYYDSEYLMKKVCDKIESMRDMESIYNFFERSCKQEIIALYASHRIPMNPFVKLTFHKIYKELGGTIC